MRNIPKIIFIFLLIGINELSCQERKRLGVANQRSILTIEDKPFSRAIPNFRISKGDTVEIYLESKNQYRIFYNNKYGWINKRKVREIESLITKKNENATPKAFNLHYFNKQKKDDFIPKQKVATGKIQENVNPLSTLDKSVKENANQALSLDSKKRERIRYIVDKNLKKIGLYWLKVKFFNE